MSVPLLSYPPKSQNQRVNGFEVPGDEQPRIFTTDNLLTATDLDVLISTAYRQIFNEQQMLKNHRQIALESQLRSGQITVKDFIYGLATSDSFRRLVHETNNNYRFAEICIQRILGRNVYSDREKIAWSAVLMTKGLPGFINALVNSEEYDSNFGDNTVPYQRRRVLPQRSKGELPFARMARYDEYYLAQIPRQQFGKGGARLDYVRWEWQRKPSPVLGQVGKVVILGGVTTIAFGILAILLGL